MNKLFLLLLVCFLGLENSIAQNIFLSPNPYTTPSTVGFPTVPQIIRVRLSPPREIGVSVSGFSCAPIIYTWTYNSTASSVVFVGTPDPVISNPGPGTSPNTNIELNGPGLYVFNLCGSACGGTQTFCRELRIIAPPVANTNPVVTIPALADLTLPVTAGTQLAATIHDPTDKVDYYWEQTSGATAITLPNPGNSVANQATINRGLALNFPTNLNLDIIQKPGNYCFNLFATDERGGNGSASRCVLVKPATSSLGINITPPGVAPDPNVLITPVNNVPLNAQITGINTFNDKILYTWSQIAGPTAITLPAPAYTANINDIPVASTTFNCPPINLNALAYGNYTLRLRAEDEYYPGTFVEQDITFSVRPPESNLDVTVTPATATTIDPYTNFNFSGRVTGINAGSDVIRTYWRQEASNPVQFNTPPFDETFASPNVVPLGTTELNSNGTLNSRITEGTYVFWYVARDIFYNVADSAKIEIIVEPGKSNFVVSIDPAGEKAITKTPDGWIINVGENPQNIPFPVKGTTTGISDKTDYVRIYWRMEYTPDASGGTQNPPLPHTAASPKEIALGTISDESILNFTINNTDAGTYDLWYVARDAFFKTADSAKLTLIVRRPVEIKPLAAFTPNGDGFNDVWTIRNIESFPDVGVRIVNERGELVFETNSVAQLPDRAWDGRRRDGKLASEGAYYYQFFDNRDQTLITAGSFIILR